MSLPSSVNGEEILRLSALVTPLLANNDRASARQYLEKIMSIDVEEDDVEAIQVKEMSIYQFMKLLVVAKDGERLIRLLQQEVRPLFSLLPKVKTTKIMRQLFDAIVECRVPVERQEEVCRDSIRWARKERRTFLRHRLELRLVEMIFKSRKSVYSSGAANASVVSVGSPVSSPQSSPNSVMSAGVSNSSETGDSETVPSSSTSAGKSSTNRIMDALQLIQTVLKELRRLDDRTLLLEAHLLESQIYYACRNISRARAALVCARTTASSIYCSPLSQAQIDLQSGLLHMEEHDYRTAFSYFYEAFEGFHSLGDEAVPARQALRYLILSKIFSGSQDDVNALLQSSHVLAYNGPELKALRSISEAYFKSDTHLFNKILQQEQERCTAATSFAKGVNEEEPSGTAVTTLSVLQDEIVRRELTGMYDSLTERHLLKLILPYHRVQIEYLANLLQQDYNDVELRISQLILDKQIHGIVDQEHHCLCIFDDADAQQTNRKKWNKLNKRRKVPVVAIGKGRVEKTLQTTKKEASTGAASSAEEEPNADKDNKEEDEEKKAATTANASSNTSAGNAPSPAVSSLYDDALLAISEYDKLVTALFDKVGGKFDSLVEAARRSRESRKAGQDTAVEKPRADNSAQ